MEAHSQALEFVHHGRDSQSGQLYPVISGERLVTLCTPSLWAYISRDALVGI